MNLRPRAFFPMLDESFLAVLRCPENRQPLTVADSATLARVNARISAAGTAPTVNRGGETVRQPLTEALVRQDNVLLYPVRQGIPILLVEEAIFL